VFFCELIFRETEWKRFRLRVEFQYIRVIVLLKRGGDSNFFCWLNHSECLFIERFKHLGYASFFLLHVGVNIEVERCGDVRMTQEHAHGFIIAILRSLKVGYVRSRWVGLVAEGEGLEMCDQ